MEDLRNASGNTVQLSPVWILIGVIFMVLMGVVGGIIGTRINSPAATPLAPDLNPLVTNVQQVTVSASSVGAQAVQNASRSVVLLAQKTSTTPKILASGLIITNDGLVVTTSRAATANILITSEGRMESIDNIGADSIYGLHYFRLPDGIFSPLALMDSDSRVASQLLTVSRSEASHETTAFLFFVNQYVVPTVGMPQGLLQLLQGTSFENEVLAGSPLISEEGKVGGILFDPKEGLVLPTSTLRASIERVANQTREVDPFTALGLTLKYTYMDIEAVNTFTAEVHTVKAGSIAAQSGLKVGDRVVKVGATTITAQTNITSLLAAPLPIPLAILRDGQELSVSLSVPSPSL